MHTEKIREPGDEANSETQCHGNKAWDTRLLALSPLSVLHKRSRRAHIMHKVGLKLELF